MGLTYNGEGVTIADSVALRAAVDVYWEIQGLNSASLYLTDIDSERIASSRYRFRVQNDILYIQRESDIPNDVWKTFISVDKEGVTIDPLLNEDDSLLLQAMLYYLKEIREMTEMVLS